MTNNRDMFSALRVRNYRLWAGGALVSNVGTWMQRVAQDWLVLTVLTHHNASAVGLVMALQFAPPLVLLPWAGYAADRFDRRKLLFATQGALGLLALGLGLVTVSGIVTLWQVYGFALLLGCVTAFDAPARQTFVNDLVGEAQLPNAVALNSTSFNAARMIGPAAAGLLIAATGIGWVFLIDAFSFAAVLLSLTRLRVQELHREARATVKAGGLAEGFAYVQGRSDLLVMLVMLALLGTFGLNFPIFISTMAVATFHGGAGQYGLLTSAFAAGSVAGTLFSARQERPAMASLCLACGAFGLGCILAAVSIDEGMFAAALVLTGFSALIFLTGSNSLMQLSTTPAMRGRVVALRIGVAMGGAPLGAPVAGWTADHLGPRWALGLGAVAGLAAMALAWRHMRKTALTNVEAQRNAA